MAFDAFRDDDDEDAGEERFEDGDYVLATFRPRRVDDLKDHLIPRIGRRAIFRALGPHEGGPYDGQQEFQPLHSWRCSWVPVCDIVDLKRISDEIGAAAFRDDLDVWLASCPA